METVLMSESLVVSSDVEETVTEVVPSRVEETVTEVLKQFTQDGGLKVGMSLESLEQKVEFTLKYKS
jgi:hypothetical protein